jgi:sugar porter (SP) family MFS transporter
MSSETLATDVELAPAVADLEHGEGYHAKETKRVKGTVILLACIAALGGLVFGYDIAGAGATFVMEGFRLHFGWECADDAIDCTPASAATIDMQKGLINGLFGIGAAIGALLNGYIAEKIGRRLCLGVSATVFILGASMQAAAPIMSVMFVGRVFSGMGVGMLSLGSPVYTGECAPEHVRGALGTLWQLAITIGILIASAANLGLQHWDQGWRISYGGNIVFAVLLVACLAFIPESPRWLAAHGSDEDIQRALAQLRFEDDLESELKKLRHEVEEERALGQAPWSEVFSNKNNMRRRVIIGFSLFAVQQLCGINAIMFYAPDILNTFFTESEAIAGTFALNTINCLSTLITVASVDKFGRTKLLSVGGLLLMFPCLLACGILSVIEQTQAVGWLVLVFAALYIVGFAFSWGPILWIMVPEMFPYHTRAKAASLCIMSNWLCTTIVGALFPVASTASLAACFFFFAAAIFIGVGITYFFQVETARKTSDEIDQAYEDHKPALKRKDW